MQIEDRTWQDVPGAPGTRLYAFLRKPDVVCSNSYIIDAPGQVLVIDPGADRKQMEEIAAQLRMLEAKGKGQPSFFLTHCHVDHCYLLFRGLGEWMPEGAVVLAQAEGAHALQRGDMEVTQARIMGWDFPPLEIKVDVRDLLGDSDLQGSVEQATVVEHMPIPGMEPLSTQHIPLGGGATLIAYHTPGHSPDSVCYQLGELLFTGDLLFAMDSGVIGIIGWDKASMLESVRHVTWLLQNRSISVCLPGHGRCLTPESALKALGRMERDLASLGDLTIKDAERIQFTSEYALDLLEEANDNFSIIAGRLYYLSYNLEDLEEDDEARKYLKMLETDRIDEMLTSFNRFVEEFHAGKKLQLQVTMKAVATMQSISAIFKGSDLEAIIDRSLVSGTTRLLLDFMNAVKGIHLESDLRGEDPYALIGEVVEDLKGGQPDDVLDCIDDPAAYRSMLARRIAHLPLFDEVEIDLSGQGGNTFLLDRHRFQDAFSGFLLDAVGGDASIIRIEVKGGEVAIEANVASAETFGANKARALKRRMELAGATAEVAEGLPLRVTFTMQGQPL
jgi:glyoxylase-like metal-dependent hydrolase (beta-lactamase superfamily II)